MDPVRLCVNDKLQVSTCDDPLACSYAGQQTSQRWRLETDGLQAVESQLPINTKNKHRTTSRVMLCGQGPRTSTKMEGLLLSWRWAGPCRPLVNMATTKHVDMLNNFSPPPPTTPTSLPLFHTTQPAAGQAHGLLAGHSTTTRSVASCFALPQSAAFVSSVAHPAPQSVPLSTGEGFPLRSRLLTVFLRCRTSPECLARQLLAMGR